MYKKLKLICFVLILIGISGCSRENATKKIIIYTSVDQVYSSAIFKDFEQKIGIKVLAVYDTEASKAIGLEKRLIMEKSHPRADIFWNSEPIRTARLAKENLFKPYTDIAIQNYQSKNYYDINRRWFGIGKRDRVIIVNTQLVKKDEYPKLLETLWSKRYRHKVAISSPYIGTAATHFAALYHAYGKKKFTQLLKEIKTAQVTYLAGNSVVKDLVGEGKYPIGLVDSDDALAGMKAGLPISMIPYNQNSTGTFSIVGTIAQLNHAPHPKAAERFMQYILTPKIEQKLIDLGAVQYSVFKQSKSKEPKQWTESPNVLLNDLQDSYTLMKETL